MRHGSRFMAILFMLLPLCNIYSQEKGAREDNTLRIMSYEPTLKSGVVIV